MSSPRTPTRYCFSRQTVHSDGARDGCLLSQTAERIEKSTLSCGRAGKVPFFERGRTLKDSIELERYDPTWPEKAAAEITHLKKAFAGLGVVDIQHMGITAVPGLAAKPIIDLMVGVERIDDAHALIPVLENLGYVFWEDNPKKDRLFFVKGMPPYGERRTHHVHIFATDHEEWEARQLFRDYLRAHPEDRQAYEALKRGLAEQFREDRETYTTAKTDFVKRSLQKAVEPLIQFIPLAESHFPLLLGWLNQPHVQAF